LEKLEFGGKSKKIKDWIDCVDDKPQSIGDSPEGPLKQPGKSCLKPAKNQSETPLT
jgi:hypothetical protein